MPPTVPETQRTLRMNGVTTECLIMRENRVGMKPLLVCFIVTFEIGAALGQTPAPGPVETKLPLSLSDLSSSFENLVARIRPAVVQIFSTGYVTSEERDSTSASLLTKQ